MHFLDLIKSTGYITVSKELAREIGLNESIILAELISQREYFKQNNHLKKGWFYCTVKKMEKHTTLKRKNQDKAINKLIRLNLIEKDNKGIPAKRHFKVKDSQIMKLFFTHKDKIPDEDCHNSVMEELYKKGYR